MRRQTQPSLGETSVVWDEGGLIQEMAPPPPVVPSDQGGNKLREWLPPGKTREVRGHRGQMRHLAKTHSWPLRL